jgi:hypothetical protein
MGRMEFSLPLWQQNHEKKGISGVECSTFSTNQEAVEYIEAVVASNTFLAQDPDMEVVEIPEDDGILLETPPTTMSSLQGRTGGSNLLVGQKKVSCLEQTHMT